MIKRIAAVLVLFGSLVVAAAPAGATCVPGYVGIRDGKPVVELPRCEGPPR